MARWQRRKPGPRKSGGHWLDCWAWPSLTNAPLAVVYAPGQTNDLYILHDYADDSSYYWTVWGEGPTGCRPAPDLKSAKKAALVALVAYRLTKGAGNG